MKSANPLIKHFVRSVLSVLRKLLMTNS